MPLPLPGKRLRSCAASQDHLSWFSSPGRSSRPCDIRSPDGRVGCRIRARWTIEFEPYLVPLFLEPLAVAPGRAPRRNGLRASPRPPRWRRRGFVLYVEGTASEFSLTGEAFLCW